MNRTLLLATAAMAALGLASGALAQAPVEQRESSSRASRTTVYEGAFFAQYAPRTALDIVQRVPGFSLDLGATPVWSLAPLRGMPLEYLNCSKSNVTDLSPLRGMPEART